jgi:hypothetical protein
MSVDPAATATATNAAAEAATAAVQALSKVLQPAAMSHHKLSLPTFGVEDPAGWFQQPEAEFTLTRLPAIPMCATSMSSVLFHLKCSPLSRDLTRDIMGATPEPYLQLKEALLSRFTVLPLQQCFHLLDLLPLGDRRPSALFAEMQALLPRDANILFNALFLRRLPDFMHVALTDHGELLPGDLAAAADLLQHSAPTWANSVSPPLPPAAVHAVQPPFCRRQSRSPPQ